MSESQSLLNRVVRNSGWNLSGYAMMLVVGVVSAPIYIKFLGLPHYGVFVLLNSILAPFGLLNVGFGQATVKYIAEAIGAGKHDQAGYYLRTTLLFNLCVGVIGAVVLVALAPFLTQSLFKVDPADHELAQAALVWTAGSWVLSQVSFTFAALPTAMQKYSVNSFVQSVFTILNQLTGITILAFGGGLIGILQARLAWAAALVVCWVIICRLLLPGVSLWPRHHGWAFRRSLHFSLWQTLASIGSLLANQADKMLLGVYVSTAAIGLFNVPNLVFSTGYTVTTKVGEVLFPTFSHLQGQGEEQRVARLVARSCWVLSVLMVGIQGAIFVFAGDILRLYVGPAFSGSAVQVLRIFAFTAILSSPTVGMDQYLLGTARTQWTALTCIATGLVTVLVSVVLIPRYGLAGAAWSDFAAIVLSRPLIHWLIWRRHLRRYVGWAEFLGSAYGPALVGMVVTGTAGVVYTRLQWEPGWLGLIAGVAAVFAVLTGLMVGLDFFPKRRQRRKDLGRLVGAVLATVGLRRSDKAAA